ncbi:hypothetical protein B0H13DRAFT_2669589 [Mycena leptocephala]|nr:hypothetical protein B0H13DRAFT_2669589 [Mycena leptocephala]
MSALGPLVDSIAFACCPYFLPDPSSPFRVTNSLLLVVLVPGCGSEHRAKASGNGVHERGGADAALARAGEDGVHNCAQHPASLTSRSNDDVGSLTPDKLTKLGFLGSRAPAYLVPSLVTALDSPPLQAHMWTRVSQSRWVYTHHPPSLMMSSDTPLVSLLELAPVRGKVARRLGPEGRSIHARPFKAIAAGFSLQGRWRTFPDWIFMYKYPHGLPSTSLPALDPLRAVADYCGLLVTAFLLLESEPESAPTRRSCPLVARACVSPFDARSPTTSTASPADRARSSVYHLAGSFLRGF